VTTPTPFTYDEVGATRRQRLPAGYRHLIYTTSVATGPAGFRAAADALLTWRMQPAAGVAVTASAPRAAPGVTVTSRLRLGPLTITAPCRVVWTHDEPDRAGFAYGTLPGHPATGEEAFLLTTDETGTVWLTVRAFSRPAGLLMRLAGPLAPLFQRRYAHRCASALRRLATP
jgi:uncharacterized protein (UPF0548 family)